MLHNIQNWLNGNLGVLWQCRVLIQEWYICYLIIVKYPLVQMSVPNKIQKLSSFKSNENIHKREDGSYYVVSANKASSVTLL